MTGGYGGEIRRLTQDPASWSASDARDAARLAVKLALALRDLADELTRLAGGEHPESLAWTAGAYRALDVRRAAEDVGLVTQAAAALAARLRGDDVRHG